MRMHETCVNFVCAPLPGFDSLGERPGDIARVVEATQHHRDRWVALMVRVFGTHPGLSRQDEYFHQARTFFFENAYGQDLGFGGWTTAGRLSYIGVLSPHRRRGYGAYIVRYVLADAAKRGRASLKVVTTLARPEAMRMYLKLGMRCVSIDTQDSFSWEMLERLMEMADA